LKNYVINIKLLSLFSALFLCVGIAQAEKALVLGPITISSTYGGSQQKYFPQAEAGKSAKLTVIIDNLPDSIEGRRLNEHTETPVVLFFSLTNFDGTVKEYKRCGAYAYSYANDMGTINYFDPSSEEPIREEMGQYVIKYTPTSAQVALTPADSTTLLPKDPRQIDLSSTLAARYKLLINNVAATEMKWQEHNSFEHKQPPGDKQQDQPQVKPKSADCAIS